MKITWCCAYPIIAKIGHLLCDPCWIGSKFLPNAPANGFLCGLDVIVEIALLGEVIAVDRRDLFHLPRELLPLFAPCGKAGVAVVTIRCLRIDGMVFFE